MTETEWRSSRARIAAEVHAEKVTKFGLTPLETPPEEPHPSVKSGFLSAGSWALQNPQPLMVALNERRPFRVLVGMRPGSALHIGHLSLIRELDWLASQGGQPLVLFAEHEASTDEVNERAGEFARAFEGLSGRPLPAGTSFVCDRSSAPVLQLEARIGEVVSVRDIVRVYGWTLDVSVNRLRTATMTAAAFLHPGSSRPEIPCVVLSDINQVTHAEIAKAASRKLKLPFPTISYRHLLPSLKGPTGRMTIRDQKTTVFLGEPDASAAKKLASSFTGGRLTVEEQRESGGEPLRCSFFHAAEVMQSTEETDAMHHRCVSGAVTCGECKAERIPTLIDRLRLTSKR